MLEALNDLNRALDLASEQQPRTKCHAHCQRGVLHRKLENLDAARADFEAAAQLGSKFAREQVTLFSILRWSGKRRKLPAGQP